MQLPPSSSARRLPGQSTALAFVLILAGVFLSHLSLLRLPYFWDEAGYYIPAARDLLFSGSVIPHSVPSNAHPPLVMAYLAGCWKLAGYSLAVTRSAMLLVAAFSLLGLFRLARTIANTRVAAASTLCTATYPVFFAQSSMAHLDLAAAGLTFWGLEAYLGGRTRACAVWLSLAVLAKETAVLAPVALLGWEIVCPWISRRYEQPLCPVRSRGLRWVALAIPVGVLLAWFAYHYMKTGFMFGNPEFFRYNVQATRNPLRMALVLGMRLWQTVGYMHLWVLTLMMAWALTEPPLVDANEERPRITLPSQLVFGVVIVAYLAAMTVVGGAVLARYMLPVVPLGIILAVSTLRRRIRRWPVLMAALCLAFIVGLFWNPPYGFSPEDNLAYRDYIVMHENAARFLEARYPKARALTAWPASDEITHPYLGYVTQPFSVVRVEDFAAEEILAAAEQRSRYDTVLIFSTKYEPPHPLLDRWAGWERLKKRFVGFHRDLPPETAAQILGGRVVFRDARVGQWIAVIEIERVEDAANGARSFQAAMRWQECVFTTSHTPLPEDSCKASRAASVR